MGNQSAFDGARQTVLQDRRVNKAVDTARGMNSLEAAERIAAINAEVAEFTSAYHGQNNDGFLGTEGKPRWRLLYQDPDHRIGTLAWAGPSIPMGYGSGVVGRYDPAKDPQASDAHVNALVYAILLEQDLQEILRVAIERTQTAQHAQAAQGMALGAVPALNVTRPGHVASTGLDGR